MSPTTITEIDITVGRRIAQRRREIRMSQVTLAEKLGISFQQIQKYERGTNRVGAGRLSEIAKTLEVPISFFFQDIPYGKVAETQAQGLQNTLAEATTAEEVRLLRAFKTISDADVKRQLLSMVEQIALTKKEGSK